MTKTTQQVRWTSEFPRELLLKAKIWGLRQKPPIQKKTAVLVALVKRGLEK